MCKVLILILSLISVSSLFASRKDYYNKISFSDQGETLELALHRLVESTHRPQSYNSLIKAYFEGDRDRSYDNDGSIVDLYSENPIGGDPYNYTTKRKKCGSYKREGDCFNREHIFPQGVFNKRGPMRSDYLHVLPSDGKVNNIRDSYPFGEVDSAIKVTKNGSRKGANTFGNEYRGIVFEPIDEFKGDIARALLYFAVRYKYRINNWRHTMLSERRGQPYKDWFLSLLLKWHKMDAVSAHEIQRNNYSEKFQGNRNPFIDHPELAERIWR